jgi:hypothetical protein
MKTILVAIARVAVIGCSSVKELQVEIVTARLIKIDTVFRQTINQEQLLTWRDQDNIEYLSFASMKVAYPVGTMMTVLRSR